jgi:alkanesulfonate monooxygenase SsuD/methylene tetrahydromethanopterin reductase-like flavin-dependent oxidoreductase (luciferase family)
MPEIRVGLLMPQYGCAVSDALDTARAADELGLDIWLAGQLFPISDQPAKPALEPLTLMGAIAAATTVSRLGFMVLAAPYLPAIYLGKALITLDHLSGGRIEIGLGAGWREEEFAALGSEFGTGAQRRATLELTLDVVAALCAGEAAPGGDGVLVSSGPASVQQPRPAFWIAGRGPRILEVVGRRADWANFARGIPIEEFRTAADTVRSVARAAGRSDGGPRLSLTGTFLGGPDPDAAARALERRAAEKGVPEDAYRAQLRAANVLCGSPADLAQQLAPYIEAGCEAAILWPLDGDHEVATSVLAGVRDALRA